MTYMYT